MERNCLLGAPCTFMQIKAILFLMHWVAYGQSLLNGVALISCLCRKIKLTMFRTALVANAWCGGT